MSHYSGFNYAFQEDPKNPGRLLLPPQHTPGPLRGIGFNMPIEVKMSSVDASKLPGVKPKTLTVFAHLDTGAFRTAIDKRIADHLGLIATGNSQIKTASGSAYVSNYVIDLIFLNAPLKQIFNLPVSSCQLDNFKFDSVASVNTSNPTSYGVLLGRDIMAFWSIFWHGPTSTVMISD